MGGVLCTRQNWVCMSTLRRFAFFGTPHEKASTMVALASTPPVAARAARPSAFSLRETFVSDKDGDGKVDLDDIFHGETEESYSLEKLARQVEARRIAAAQAAEEVQRESLQKAEQRRLKREALEAEVEERRRSLEARRAADAHEAEIQASTLLALSLSEEAKQMHLSPVEGVAQHAAAEEEEEEQGARRGTPMADFAFCLLPFA